MLDKNFNEALKIIYQRLNFYKIKWALIGSVNMILQGMDVEPRDLDIVVQLKDLEKIKEIFSDCKPLSKELKPLTKFDTKKSELRFKVNNVEVQIIGEIKEGLYIKDLLGDKLIAIKIDNLEIPCRTLELEAQTYEKLDRLQKAELIRDFLNNL